MANTSKKNHVKGAQTEELLGAYFRKAGYIAIRGVPFDYKKFSVTDIDLWLYLRSSSVSRQIAIVDIKKRKTPQAMERIFWTKGLQSAVNADQAIVATTDSRDEVKSFGIDLDVTVLDGKFLKRLEQSEAKPSSRISEEEFAKIIESETFGTIDGDWKGKIQKSKQLLTNELNFDSVNLWLEYAKYFSEQIISGDKLREVGLRCLFRTCAYIGIGIDYILKDLSFCDPIEKEKLLKSGFTYGQSGLEGVDISIGQSLTLIQQFGGVKRDQADNIKKQVHEAFNSLPTSILAEYFSQSSVGRDLFLTAKEFDDVSMSKEDPSVVRCSNNCRAFIGCLLDFWGVDRVKFKLNDLSKNGG